MIQEAIASGGSPWYSPRASKPMFVTNAVTAPPVLEEVEIVSVLVHQACARRGVSNRTTGARVGC
jgi:hypothetical protein